MSYDEIDIEIAVEGLISGYKDKIKNTRMSEVIAQKSNFIHMRPSEREKAWQWMIRTLKTNNYLPRSIRSNDDKITRYDIYGSSIIGYNDLYESGIRMIIDIINENFDDSKDALNYLQNLIAQDKAVRKQRQESLERINNNLNQMRQTQIMQDMQNDMHRQANDIHMMNTHMM